MFEFEFATRTAQYTDAEIETAIIALGREPRAGLVALPGAFTFAHRAPMISAARLLLPRHESQLIGALKTMQSGVLVENSNSNILMV